MDGSYGVSIEFTHGAGSMELAKKCLYQLVEEAIETGNLSDTESIEINETRSRFENNLASFDVFVVGNKDSEEYESNLLGDIFGYADTEYTFTDGSTTYTYNSSFDG